MRLVAHSASAIKHPISIFQTSLYDISYTPRCANLTCFWYWYKVTTNTPKQINQVYQYIRSNDIGYIYTSSVAMVDAMVEDPPSVREKRYLGWKKVQTLLAIPNCNVEFQSLSATPDCNPQIIVIRHCNP